MYCYYHPEREAAGACVECGRRVCLECKVEFDGKVYCNPCIERRVGSPAASECGQPAPATFGNTSGMGGNSPVPPGLGEFNWGGFLLTWIWGIGNNVWWSFLTFVPWLGWIVMPWVLAFKGNEWAWRSRHCDGVEHFNRVQHTWATWGWIVTIVFCVVIVLFIVVGTVLAVLALQQYTSRSYR